MATFTVTQDDLTDAVTFLEQFLTTKLPQFDFSEGTANRDIAINSMAYLTAYMRNEIKKIKDRQSLLKMQTAEIDYDEDADEIIDEILSDWFINRKTGRKSGGYATLRFSRQNIGVVVFRNTDVFTRNTMNFQIPGETYTVQATDLTRNTDNLGITYYTASIPLVAVEVGTDYDIDAGPFSSFPQVSPYLVGVRNEQKFSGGKEQETSEEMIKRSETAITVRDLNTVPSIQTVLSEYFPQVLEVAPIGMGDPEMLRDQIEILSEGGRSLTIHRGSMIDAYVKFPMEFNSRYAAVYPDEGGLTAMTYVVDGEVFTGVKLPEFPIYKIHRLIDNSTDTETDVPFTVVTPSVATWNSNRQEIYLKTGTAFSGLLLDLEYDTVTGYTDVQDFVEDSHNRVIVSDTLVKASYAMYLAFDLRYYPSAAGIGDVEAAKAMLREYIHGRSLGEEFRVSEITAKFSETYPGNVVQLPFLVVGSLHLPNGKVLDITFEDRIKSPEKYYYDESSPDELYPLFTGDEEPAGKTVVVLADIQVSPRTTRFVVNIDTDDIKLTAI